ncbi:MAG: efflux transporter outer membrane subunit [Desulfobulbaceae bacterium]
MASHFIFRNVVGVYILLCLGGCSPFSVPDRSGPPAGMPAAYSLDAALSVSPGQRWWEAFEAPSLSGMIEDALADNLTLEAQRARLEKAGALARQAESGSRPTLTGEAGVSHTESEGSAITQDRRFSAGLVAGYEIDLWGRVHATRESAALNAAATREDLDAAAMTVAAEVARRWIGIVARNQELDLLERQLATNRTYLELVELRFRTSLATSLDVMQQRQLVERIRARIPRVELQQRLLRNQLAVLTGRSPDALPAIGATILPEPEGPPAAGLPARLLENRPDIRAARARLEAADQELVAARADLLPAIRLTGSATTSGRELDRLLDNWLLNLAGSLTAPLLDGGRRKAQVEAARATVRERLALYRQTVLNALREVEDSLAQEDRIRSAIAATELQLEAARSALAEARSRYVNGVNDYLPVLTQLLAVQNLEADLVTAREELLAARISLYRSIGGTWTGTMIYETPDTEREDERS